MELYISLGSLAVAALALIVGPIVSWKIAKHQTENSLRVSNKQIISPIRQNWIDSLRNRVAELLSEAHWHYVAGDDDSFTEIDKNLIFLKRQIELMLNPGESDHQILVKHLDDVVKRGLNHRAGNFPESVEKATSQCQSILKREWERVKNEI